MRRVGLAIAFTMGLALTVLAPAARAACPTSYDPAIDKCYDTNCNLLAENTLCPSDNECALARCTADGQCTDRTNKSGPCQNPNNHCQQGTCAGQACHEPSNGWDNPCDDTNVCTTDACTEVISGTTLATGHTCNITCNPNATPCCDGQCHLADTNSLCTSTNECAIAKCTDDGLCTDRTNKSGPCQNPNDHCQQGTCSGQTCHMPSGGYTNPCDDSNACSQDNCTNIPAGTTLATGHSCDYVWTPPNGPCDTDSNLCTLEKCDASYNPERCVPNGNVSCTPPTADCTTNTCSPADGMCHTAPAPVNTLCTDTNNLDCKSPACDGNNAGSAGCTKLLNCSTCANDPCTTDGNPCTRGVCNNSGGCINEGPFTIPDPSTVSCASDNNSCTKDVCNTSGSCTHNADPTQNGLACTGNANTCASSSLCVGATCTTTACRTTGYCQNCSGLPACTNNVPTCGCN